MKATTRQKIILTVAVAFLAALSIAAISSNDNLRMIQDGDEEERTEAAKELLKQRQETIAGLLNIVRQPIADGELFYGDSSRNTAIELLGDIRATEAAEELVKWAVVQPGQLEIVSELPVSSPAGIALMKIGLPAIPFLIEEVKSRKNTNNVIEYGRVVFLIKGKADATSHFQRILAETEDEQVKQNIRHVLKYIGQQ